MSTPEPAPVQSADLLTIEELQIMLGVSRSGVLYIVQRRDFPSPVKIVWRTGVWRTADVEAWIQTRADRGVAYGPGRSIQLPAVPPR